MGFAGLEPAAPAFLAAVFLDALFGDPRYRLHPIRLMGASLTAFETLLRKLALDGYAGGCLLFALLAAVWVAGPSWIVSAIYELNATAGFAAHVLLVYSLLALRDLIDHVRAVQTAARSGDVEKTRAAVSRMVGRDTAAMDLEACRRAAIESLAENFVDGFLSAVFWYVLAGLPGLLLFKVVSTMDSMVGYKTAPYLRFGWCGARLDDAMNYAPARLAWLLLGFTALFFPGLSAGKGWRIGLEQHAVLPGPNPGWSEAAMAGLLQRRLIGPIVKKGQVVTERWIGDPSDPPAGKDGDVTRAIRVAAAAAFFAAVAAAGVLVFLPPFMP